MKRKRRIIIFPILLTFIAAATTAVSAAGGTKWYENNAYLLSTNSIVKSALRSIGWGITKILCMICDVVGTLYDVTFNMIDITKYGKINDILTTLRPVLAVLIILGFVVLGLTILIDPERRPPLARNLLLVMVAVTCSMYAFNLLNDMSRGFKEGILGSGKMHFEYSLVDGNMIDLVRIGKSGNVDSINYSKGISSGLVGAGISDSNKLALIDINETLDYSDHANGKDLYGWSDRFNQLISEKIVVKEGGVMDTTEIYKGLFTTTIGNEFYYRYKFNYLACWIELAAYLIMIIALSYKNVRLMYELVVARILAYLHAADITSGERLKQILLFIRDTYIILGISVLSLKLFAVITDAVTASGIVSAGHGIGGNLMESIIILFIAFCVIDGPNIAERILGMDAGLSRSYARAMGIMGAGLVAARKVGSSVSGAKHLSGKAAASGSGGNGSEAGSGSGGRTGSGGHPSGNNVKADAAISRMDRADSERAASRSASYDTDASAPGSSEESGSPEVREAQAADDYGNHIPAEAAGSEVMTEGSAPDFMDSYGSGAGPGRRSTGEKDQTDDQTGSRMTVDFMEKGSGQRKPITSGNIPERKVTSNSQYAGSMPAEKMDKTQRREADVNGRSEKSERSVHKDT